MKITEFKKPTISVELVPPKNGREIKPIIERVKRYRNRLDFVSVTKGAVGSLRAGSLPLGFFIQENLKLPVVAHFVTREHSRFEIENELVDLHHFGIRNILALRGDPPAGSSEGWKGEYKYAYLLVEQIKRMNQGIYLKGNGFKTDFCVGVAGHPENFNKEFIERKIRAGADFIITQMVFSFDEFKDYVEALDVDIPVIAGIRVLKSMDEVKSTEDFFKVKVNDGLKKNINNWRAYYREMVLNIMKFGYGVHLFCLNQLEVLDELGLRER